MVHAVDADFAVAIDPLHERAEHDVQAVAVLGVLRVLVRNRFRHVLRQVQEEVAPLRDVEELHADADAQDRHPPLGDLPHQHAVEIFAAGVHRADAGVDLKAVAAGVEIAAADQHEALSMSSTRERSSSSSIGGTMTGMPPLFSDGVVVAGRAGS